MSPTRTLIATAGVASTLLCVAGAGQAQPARPVIAVESVKGGNNEVPNLRTMLETAIINTGRFTVMSTGDVDALEKTEALCGRGQVWRLGRCRAGSLITPDYRISAVITSAATNRTSGGLDLGAILGRQQQNTTPCITIEPYLSLDIRVTAKSSGKIEAGESVSEKGKKVTSCDGKEPSAAGAFELMMRPVADRLSRKLVLTSFPIEVIDVQPGNRVLLTYGEDVLAIKQQFDLFRKGGMVTDSTGRQFQTTVLVGTAEVISVAPATSIAEVLCTVGGTPPETGLVARNAAKNQRRQKPPKGSSIPGECK